MFADAMRSIAEERASFMRDAEYIVESTKDAPMQESILIYENAGESGLCLESDIVSPELKNEIKEAIEQIPDDDTDAKEEISRIVSSDKDQLSLDEVMGLTTEPASDAEQLLDAVADLTVDSES